MTLASQGYISRSQSMRKSRKSTERRGRELHMRMMQESSEDSALSGLLMLHSGLGEANKPEGISVERSGDNACQCITFWSAGDRRREIQGRIHSGSKVMGMGGIAHTVGTSYGEGSCISSARESKGENGIGTPAWRMISPRDDGYQSSIPCSPVGSEGRACGRNANRRVDDAATVDDENPLAYAASPVATILVRPSAVLAYRPDPGQYGPVPAPLRLQLASSSCPPRPHARSRTLHEDITPHPAARLRAAPMPPILSVGNLMHFWIHGVPDANLLVREGLCCRAGRPARALARARDDFQVRVLDTFGVVRAGRCGARSG
ncbi:hypothetical protein K488DRAFT_75120 [Vararia minispora EC-137]|uniref:Uncharacterized protein n=1 Tax=Vararia minispora EC-137 TaxID=1314806 RepID=A0ACB8Q4Q5_9AGAM|nr:hypothetical protein K488DRAFT_75120 [Vararia minispora EC-137]